MKTIFVHIGMHKTGSTSIQASMGGYDDGSIRYADLKDGKGIVVSHNHSVPISSVFSENRYHMRFFRQRGISKKLIDTVVPEYRANLIREMQFDRDILIISGEDICTMSEVELRNMKSLMEEYCDEIKIFGYVRDPIGYASSQFQQRVKVDAQEIQIPRPKYREKFENFFKVFGRDAVTLRPFERSQLKDGSAVQDMMSSFGQPNKIWPEVSTNESLSEDATRLLFHFNKFGPITTGCPQAMLARRRFVNILSKSFPGPSFRFPTEIFGSKSVDVSDMEWLRDATGIDVFPKIPENTDGDMALLKPFFQPKKSELVALRSMLKGRGITTRSTISVIDALTFLFYDVLSEKWNNNENKTPQPNMQSDKSMFGSAFYAKMESIDKKKGLRKTVKYFRGRVEKFHREKDKISRHLTNELIKARSVKSDVVSDFVSSFSFSDAPYWMVKRTDKFGDLSELSSFRALLTARTRAYSLCGGYYYPEKILQDKKYGYQFSDLVGFKNPLIDMNIAHYDLEPHAKTVIKPMRSAGSRGVYLIEAENKFFDVSEGEWIYSWDVVKQRIEKAPFGRLGKRFMRERLICDSTTEDNLPYDFKFYCFYGQVELVGVIKRHPFVRDKWFDGEGLPIDRGFETVSSSNDLPAPSQEAIQAARNLSLQIPAPFCRIDLISGDEGLFLSEFTARPGTFHRYSKELDMHFGNEYMKAENRLQQDLFSGRSFEAYRKLVQNMLENSLP